MQTRSVYKLRNPFKRIIINQRLENVMSHPDTNLIDSLRILFPNEKLTWISEGELPSKPIEWACLEVKEGQAGDLLLIQAGKLNRKEVKAAEEKGLVAILATGKNVGIKNLYSTLPIILVDTQKHHRQIFREFVRLITQRSTAINERKLQIHTQLTKLAADGAGLSGLVRAMREITRHGVLIHDKRLNMIAGDPSADIQSFWKDITDQLSNYESLPYQLHDRQLAGEDHIEVIQELSGGISRVIVPIIVENIARGYLSVIGIEGTLDILDQLVAEEGALICAIEMSRTKAVRETEKKLHSDLLTALLQEDLSPRDAKLWVDAIGLDATQAHAALQFAWDSPDPPSRRRLETLINGEVARMGLKVILNPAGEAVICFCQVSPNDEGCNLALELGENVLIQAKSEYPDAQVRCGVGCPTTDLNLWHISFKEAGIALDMATRLNEEKPLYYPDLSVHRLLMLLENNPELKIFQEDILGDLLAQEGKNNFIETLEAYFEQKGNLSQTADSLFIHRNTLSYRMDRIEEITGMNLSNPDTALAVQLALKIYRMLQGKPNNS
jgi:purine catabolism regulator